MGLDMYLDDQKRRKNKLCDECENKAKIIVHATTRSKTDRIPWYICGVCYVRRYSDDFYYEGN